MIGQLRRKALEGSLRLLCIKDQLAATSSWMFDIQHIFSIPLLLNSRQQLPLKTNTMATLQEKNKAVVQKYFEEYWGKGNVNVVDEVCADEFVIDYPMHGPRRGREAAKKMLLEFREV